MALDFGGLDYTINVRDKFSSNVEAFRRGIVGARADFKAFKQEVGRPIRSTGQRELARATREQANAQREATRQLRAGRQEQRDSIRRTGIRASAIRQLNAETRRQAVSQERARQAIQRQLTTERRLSTVEQQRVIAASRLTAILEKRTAAQNILVESQRRGIALTIEEQKRLGLLTAEQAKLFAARKKLAEQAALLGNNQLRKIIAETDALRRQNTILQKQATLRALQARGLGTAAPGQRISPAVEDRTLKTRIANFLQLDKSQQAAAASANRFSFTFRRLIGILAAFTIVRLIVRGFTDLVRQLVLFNANIEQSRLGIAALFTAVGDVRTATGEAAESSEALALAQKEAARQTKLLRKEALQTAATFDTLLETFQVAVAPGLVAGLDLDEIRQFTVRISQAAAAIGLQQNQLAEEIRSILSGTIQARTTRIAVALGITNEDIRLAREAGVLTEFLNERFEAFKEAGIEALGTFNALLTNTRDAILLLFEEGGLEFFEELKGLLADIQALIVSTDIGDALTPNPQAVSVVRAIADGLRDAVAQVRALISPEGLGGLQGLATLIGQTISVVSAVLAPVIGGILAGLNDIQNGFEALKELISGLGLDEIFGGEFLAEAVKQIVRFVTAFAVVATVALTFLGSIKLIVSAVAILPGLFLSTAGSIAASVVALGLAIDFIKRWTEEIIGARLSFVGFLKVIGFAIGIAFAKFALTVKTFFLNVFSAIRIGIVASIAFAINFLLNRIRSVLTLLAKVSDTAADALAGLAEAQDVVNNGLKRQIQLSKDAIKQRNKELTIAKRRLDTALAEVSDEIAAEGAENSETLRVNLSEIPGIIQRSRQPLESQGKLIKELADDAQRAADALAFAGATEGVGGGALEQRTIEFERQLALRDKGLILTTQEQEAQKTLIAIERDRTENARVINALDQRQQVFVAEAVENAEQLLAARSDLVGATNATAIAQLALKNASEEEKDAAQGRLDIAKDTETGIRETIFALTKERQGIEDVLTSANKTKEAQELVTKTITDRVQINGREVAAQERTADIARDRVNLELRLNQIANDRIRLVAQQQTRESFEGTRRQRLETENARRELAREQLPFFEQEAVLIQNRLRSAALELQIANEKAVIDRESLLTQIEGIRIRQQGFLQANTELSAEQQIVKVKETQAILEKAISDEQAKGTATNQERVKSLQAQLTAVKALLSDLQTIDALDEQLSFADEESRAQIEALIQQVIRLQDELGKINELDITGPAEQLKASLESAVNTLNGVGVQVVSQFATFASNAIVDAFDPTKDVNIKERFARFLQGIARLIIQTLIQIAITRAILGLSGTPVTGGATPPPVPNLSTLFFTAKKGGLVPDGFANARGFDAGGIPNTPAKPSTRPQGLPASDTVPVWTTPGEWIIRQAAAAKYGNSVMSAINRGLIDPTELRSLVGVGRRSLRINNGPGFQDGGLISDNVASQAESEGGSAGQSAAAPIVVPVMVADRNMMERLLAAGGEAMIDFMRENQDIVQASSEQVG